MANPERITFASEKETITADLYGTLPAKRVVILVHGMSWDASGWREVAPRFPERGVPALAVDLRGYGGSSGKTNQYRPDKPWTAVADLRAAKAVLAERGVKEIALVGTSMGASVALVSSFEANVECVVGLSGPAGAVPSELAQRITGRKLFVCADRDRFVRNVISCFTDAHTPKTLALFPGSEHSRAMFKAPYAEEAITTIVDFVCRRA